jgi:hypothetical protein
MVIPMRYTIATSWHEQMFDGKIVVCCKLVTQEQLHMNEKREWATDAFDKARPGVYIQYVSQR